MQLKLYSLARTLLIPGLLAGLALAATPSHAQDPPGLSRLSNLAGNVSVQPNGEDAWGQASNNMPVGSGDRVFTDQTGRGEFSGGMVRAYFGPDTDLTLININGQGIEYGLARGSANFHSDGFPPGMSLFVSTPNGGVTLSGPGGVRVDVYPDQQSTIVTNRNQGVIQVNGAGGFSVALRQNQCIQLSGTNPVYSQLLEPAPWDDFEHYSEAIESHRFSSPTAQYVSVEMPGYEELDGNGDWQPQSQYGPIWFPRVQAGWAPYHYGHWVSMPYYGWTWVADEPWGAAPFHYGRWVAVGGRWGWIPGPREGHPIWSPAQVVFAGGIQIGGVGVSVWFPLGPGEAYKPWYPCTPEYINRINITNIHESPVVHVQVNYVNIVNVTNVTYVNRTSVVAMNTSDFASGRSAQAASVKVDPHQIPEHVQPAAPAAKPPAQRIMLHPTAKPAAAPAARPVLINHEGKMVSAAPNAKPVVVPVKAAVAPKPIPGRTPAGAPSVGGKPAPAAVKPAEPKTAAEPAKSTPEVKTVPKTAPPAPEAKPATKSAPPTPMMKPADKPAVPEAKPAAKPATPEAKPAAKPATAPASKDDKKKEDKKKDDKKPEDKKPD